MSLLLAPAYRWTAVFRLSGVLRGSGKSMTLEKTPYPVCDRCQAPLKPEGVFFGEDIPSDTVETARTAAKQCHILIIIGASGIVYPAADIPFLAASGGATVIEVNVAPTPFTRRVTEHFIDGNASQVLPRLLKTVSCEQ